MHTKMFLSLLAAGSFCVIAPAQAQQTESKKTSASQTPTKQSAGKANKQGSATSNKAADKSGNAGAKAAAPQKVEVVMGTTGLNPSAINLSAGNIGIQIVNSSDKPHKIVLEGGTMKKIVSEVAVGGSGMIDGTLVAGTYTLSCQASGHMESRAKVTVK